jgi:hypothetical protein
VYTLNISEIFYHGRAHCDAACFDCGHVALVRGRKQCVGLWLQLEHQRTVGWNAYGNIRLIDLDADGIDEILVGGNQITCRSSIYQLSLFHRNQATNQYAQLNYGQDGVFLGIEFYAFIFEALGRSGSALPDIIACQYSSSRLAVLENHGGLNFSISGVAFSSVVACDGPSTVIAVADTDHDGSDEVFSSSPIWYHFFTRLPNTTLVSAASRFPVLPVLRTPPERSPTSMATRMWT